MTWAFELQEELSRAREAEYEAERAWKAAAVQERRAAAARDRAWRAYLDAIQRRGEVCAAWARRSEVKA